MSTRPARPIRAVALLVRDGQILLMDRLKQGKRYCVFIGGGVEEGESVEAAVVRETREESCLEVRPLRLVYRCHYDDGTRHDFYLCEHLSGAPKLDDQSPEATRDLEESGVYTPKWFPLSALPTLLLYPLEVRDWVIADAPRNFAGVYREESFEVAKKRQTI